MVFLPLPFLAECISTLCDECLVTGRINEGIPAVGLHFFIFSLQVKIGTVGPQEKVNRQAEQDGKGLFIVLRNARVVFVAYENIAGIDVRTANYYCIQ